MARYIQGPLTEQQMGTVGGVTFSQVANHKVARTWRAPVNKRRLAQRQRRQAFARISSRWFEALTSAQRTAWDSYAATVTFYDSLGVDYTISGFQMFMRTHLILDAASMTIVDAAPVPPGLPTSRTCGMTFTHATGVFQLQSLSPAGLAADRLVFQVILYDRVTRTTPRGRPLSWTVAVGNIGLPTTIFTYTPPIAGSAGDMTAFARFYYYDSNNRFTNVQLVSATST
jgi:hypothetical protein